MKSWFPHNSAWEEASQSKSVLFFVNFQKNNNTKQNKMRNSSRFRVRSTFRRPIGSAWRVPKKKRKFAKQHQQQQQQRVGPILQKRERMRQHQSHRWFFFKYWFLIWLLHEFSLMGKRLRSTSFCIVFKIISSFIFTKCHVVDLLCVVGKGEISLCW